MNTDERTLRRTPNQPSPEGTRTRITDEEIEGLKRKLAKDTEIEAAKRRKEREEKDAEVAKLVAELEELRKRLPVEEVDLEEALREAEAEYKSIPMYDWGAKEISNEHDMSQKYGSRITSEIRRCKWDAERIPKSLIAEMHRIHEGRLPAKRKKAQPPISQKKDFQKTITSQVKWDEIQQKAKPEPKSYSNEQFSPVKAGLFNVARGNKDLQNPTTILLYLLQHRSWEGKKDKHGTYHIWYLKRRLIVASVGVEKICADLGVHEKTVRNWTNALHKSGVIKKLKSGRDGIYVLGEVIGKKELFYYSGEISWQPKSGVVH